MPTSIDGRLRLAPAERKRLLLNDAVEIFANRGIGRGGHTEIAEKAGVSVATVFNYFNTREDLVEAVLDEVENRLISLAEEIYCRGDSPLDAIHNHAKAFIELCETHPSYIKVWLEWSCSIRDGIWGRYIDFQNKLLSLIAEQVDMAITNGDLKEGLTAHERARWLLSSSQMLITMIFDPSGKPEDMQQTVDRGISHLLGDLKN